jgi:mRNA-degrading endonuclease RelE of RelBE toxin-antitoxin system
MVEVRFSHGFEKQLKKSCSKSQAKKIVNTLSETQPTDGDYVSQVGAILIKEKKVSSFRFYFIQDATRIEFLSEEEFNQRVLLFLAMSKKNNQQDVIDKLKEDLKKSQQKR